MSQSHGPTTLTINTLDAKTARVISQSLDEFTKPAPSAVSTFEDNDANSDNQVEWRIDAYFDEPPDEQTLRSYINDKAKNGELTLTLAPTPDENWVALSQAALPPVHAGRFTIHGSHDRHRVAIGPNTIEIEAGEAFGTAHHETTYLCIEAIGKLAHNSNIKHALDLGCGSGILAIALARSSRRCSILASDIDPKAIDVTRENAKINNARNRITSIVANGITHPDISRPNHFDLIIANILAKPLIEIAQNLATIASPRAHVVLSGLLTTQARSVLATYRTAGFICRSHKRKGEWSALILQKT